MDTSPSGASQGKSMSATKSCPSFWLLQATQPLMKMYLVYACHSSSLVHNQRYVRLQSTAGLSRPHAISKALEILCTHKLTASLLLSTWWTNKYIAYLHFPSSTKSYCASKGPVQDRTGCCCQNNYSAQSNLASAPRHGNRRVPSSNELLTVCSHLTFSQHCGLSLFTCRGMVLPGEHDGFPYILTAGYRKNYAVPWGTGI